MHPTTLEKLKECINGISEKDITRVLQSGGPIEVWKSVLMCTKKNTNQSVSKPRVSE